MRAPQKICEIAQLTEDVAAHKRLGHRVALIHAPFGGLNETDLEFLQTVADAADIIVASVPDDASLPSSALSAQNQNARLERAASAPGIDFVALVPWREAGTSIASLVPDIFALPPTDSAVGAGGLPVVPADLEALGRIGGELRTFDRRSGCLVERRRRITPIRSERTRFVQGLLARHSSDEIQHWVDSLRTLKVAVVGETIIDEYAYCNAMGKSGKEPMLVTRFASCEAHAGGALAIANHLAEFCDHVELVSALGTEGSHADFVQDALEPAVRPTFITNHQAPTIVKRRYIDAYSLAKMFGVYHIGDQPLCAEDEQALCRAIERAIERCDLIIAADYGHGLITRRAVELLVTRAKFLAVNTQLNAANAGYHTLSKYPRADYVCLHEGELRLDARDLHGDLHDIMRATAERLDIPSLLITLGKRGILLYRRASGFVHCPALATHVLERVGAGDAVLALTSLAIAGGLPPMVISLLGNLAGAQAVAVLGNSASIQKTPMLESIRLLMNDADGKRLVAHRPTDRAVGQGDG